MTPHRMQGRGTFRLDRQFHGIGRITRASGTNDLPTYRAIDAMLTSLYGLGRADVLIEIREGRLKPVLALGWFRQGRLDQIPTGELLRPFLATWESWARGLDCSTGHRKDLASTLRALAPGDQAVAQAHTLFLALKRAKAAHPTTLRKAKMHMMAFLRDTVGSRHALYAAVAGTPIPRVRVARKAAPLGVAEVKTLLDTLPPAAAAMVWTLCATGMGPKEYWGPWTVLEDRIEIHGTKRVGRHRIVPHWTATVRPTMGAARLAAQVSGASGGTIKLYDCRATFARWLEEAGVIRSHRSAYLGHGSKTMTEHYERGELPGQLAADAQKLVAYAGLATPGLRLARRT